MEDDRYFKQKVAKESICSCISGTTDFKPKEVTRDKDGYYIMIKVIIPQEDITFINV